MSSIDIFTYNVMIPVTPPLRFHGQLVRARKITNLISDYMKGNNVDVIVLTEVMVHSVDSVLESELKVIGFLYKTKQISSLFKKYGGIVIYSKLPIVYTCSTAYGSDCHGYDCFSAKGIVYARMEYKNSYINVFATHMQSGESNSHVRLKQMKVLKQFVASLHLPENELVCLCGDLNVDMYLQKAELNHMLFELQAVLPVLHKDSAAFTIDKETNQLVGFDDPSVYKDKEWPDGCAMDTISTQLCKCCKSEWVDYVLPVRTGCEIFNCCMKSVALKVPPFDIQVSLTKTVLVRDLSDHYPVVGHIEFQATESNCNAFKPFTNTKPSNNTLFVLIITISVTTVIVICYITYIIRRKSRETTTGRIVPFQRHPP